jgi:general secretion pathway protein D
MKMSLRIRLVALAAAIQLPPIVAVGEPTPADANLAGSDHEKTRTELLERVLQSWQRPGGFEERASDATADIGGLALRKKLETISIPVVNFTNVELNRVVSALSALAEEFDLTDEKPKGVNIVLIDPANANPTVTITLRNLTLKRILDFVTDTAGYQYEIQADAVVVRPGGERTVLATEVFPVARSTVIRMTGLGSGATVRHPRSAETAVGGKDDGPAIDEAPALRHFFQQAGVSFESVAGSSLAYDGSAIIVTQTARNLERLHTILCRYQEVRQV